MSINKYQRVRYNVDIFHEV